MLGRSLPARVRIGARGLTSAVAHQVQHMLGRSELVKVRLPAEIPDRRQLADTLAIRTRSAMVGVVGRMVLLYRPNPNLSDSDRIELP